MAPTDSHAIKVLKSWQKTRTGEPDLMKKSTFIGSTVGVLLFFSIISYSQNLVKQQQSSQPNQERTQVAGTSAADTATTNSSNPAASAERPREINAPAPITAEKSALSESFEATAYSLRGRTASGAVTAPGMIAADPRVLPIGSRVRIEAGSYSGEYIVADTGGAVRGRRIDIWTPTTREAMRFGRRTVKLTILHLPVKRGTKSTRPRTVSPAQASTASPVISK
jgi:3D (Asp-Asp-Asp) domain-containing protein